MNEESSEKPNVPEIKPKKILIKKDKIKKVFESLDITLPSLFLNKDNQNNNSSNNIN